MRKPTTAPVWALSCGLLLSSIQPLAAETTRGAGVGVTALWMGSSAPPPFCHGQAAEQPASARVWDVRWVNPGESKRIDERRPPAIASGNRLRAELAVPPARAVGAAARKESQGATKRPVAVEYSDAYRIRRKIHVYASMATLPLFAAELWVGQSLYNHPGQSESKRSVHGALATGIGVLFGANSVTGVWNLWEGRRDPEGRTRRVVHGILMLAADAGFAATGALAPDEEGGEGRGVRILSNRRSTHRAVALTSMGTAVASYVIMLIGRN
jgi:hypothetical protein